MICSLGRRANLICIDQSRWMGWKAFTLMYVRYLWHVCCRCLLGLVWFLHLPFVVLFFSLSLFAMYVCIHYSFTGNSLVTSLLFMNFYAAGAPHTALAAHVSDSHCVAYMLRSHDSSTVVHSRMFPGCLFPCIPCKSKAKIFIRAYPKEREHRTSGE